MNSNGYLIGQKQGVPVAASPTNLADSTAVFVPLQAYPHVFVTAGLTKQQKLASEIVGHLLGRVDCADEESVEWAVDRAIQAANLLLAKTAVPEKKANGHESN